MAERIIRFKLGKTYRFLPSPEILRERLPWHSFAGRAVMVEELEKCYAFDQNMRDKLPCCSFCGGYYLSLIDANTGKSVCQNSCLGFSSSKGFPLQPGRAQTCNRPKKPVSSFRGR